MHPGVADGHRRWEGTGTSPAWVGAEAGAGTLLVTPEEIPGSSSNVLLPSSLCLPCKRLSRACCGVFEGEGYQLHTAETFSSNPLILFIKPRSPLSPGKLTSVSPLQVHQEETRCTAPVIFMDQGSGVRGLPGLLSLPLSI